MPPTTPADLIPDLTGKLIDDGRLILMELVGSGSYGKVFRAVEVKTKGSSKPTSYAVKCLIKPTPGSRHSSQLARELAVHGTVCKHPNVVTMHRIVTDEYLVYVIMDLAETDVHTLAVEKELFLGNDGLVKQVFVQVIDAVQHCHDLDVAHRDIKPENLLCDRDGGNVRLTDFGLSTTRRLGDSRCGSTYYMSPECLRVGEFRLEAYSTKHNDVWALGVLLVNLICLHNPWNIASPSDEFFAQYLKNPDWIQEALPISSGAHDIVKNLLHRNPLCRMPLWKLRAAVLALDTFSRTSSGREFRSLRKPLIIARKAVASIFRRKDLQDDGKRDKEISEKVYALVKEEHEKKPAAEGLVMATSGSLNPHVLALDTASCYSFTSADSPSSSRLPSVNDAMSFSPVVKGVVTIRGRTRILF